MDKTVQKSFNGDMSIYSSVSNPVPDAVIIGEEGKDKFKYSIIWILVDLFATIILVLVEYKNLGLSGESSLTACIIEACICVFILLLFLIFVLSHKTILSLIAKYSYISIGGLYYLYKLVKMIMYLIQNEADISNIALVKFCLILASIVPRIFAFNYIESYGQVLARVDESRRMEEHEKFLEKIGNKIDKGYSRWSNTLEVERASNANYFNNNDSSKNSIKDE